MFFWIHALFSPLILNAWLESSECRLNIQLPQVLGNGHHLSKREEIDIVTRRRWVQFIEKPWTLFPWLPVICGTTRLSIVLVSVSVASLTLRSLFYYFSKWYYACIDFYKHFFFLFSTDRTSIDQHLPFDLSEPWHPLMYMYSSKWVYSVCLFQSNCQHSISGSLQTSSSGKE